MPELKITDPPPMEIRAQIQADLRRLRDALDDAIPAKVPDRNLLICTWNIREFGDLTKKWRAEPGDSPKRDFHAVRCIAEIVSRFDVIALQEVTANLRSFRHMLKVLGRDWGFSLTDVNRGASGNSERMAFVFDTRKVVLSGLAAELVVPKEQLEKEIRPDALEEQFSRTPYAVSFQSGGRTFILVTLHVKWKGGVKKRIGELQAIAQWMSDWANYVHAYDHNLIALGDFNIDRRGSMLYEAFTSTGLYVPEELHEVPRTIFRNPRKPKCYDQIAWFTEESGCPALKLKYLRGGSFDFPKVAMKSLKLTKQQLSWRISDHCPLWVEFSVRD
jgi:endonuclease/exonuclease/phosphatase family metal-dependent hydrolase